MNPQARTPADSYPWDDEPPLSVKRQQVLTHAQRLGYPKITLLHLTLPVVSWIRRKDEKNIATFYMMGPGVTPWWMFVTTAEPLALLDAKSELECLEWRRTQPAE